MINIFFFSALMLFAVLSWQHYRLSLLLAVALVPTYLLRMTIFHIPTNFFELLVVILFVSGLVRHDIRAKWWGFFRTSSPLVWLSVLGFLGACLLSTVISDQLLVSLGILKGWVIVPLLFALLVASYLDTSADRQRFISWVITAGVLVSFISLTQYRWSIRLAGIYDVPNSLALWLVPVFILAVWTSRLSLWRLMSAAVIGITILATQSLGAVFAIMGSLAVGMLWWRRTEFRCWLRPLSLLLVLGIIYFGITGRLYYISSPLFAGQSNSVTVRGQLWGIGVQLIGEHPLLGVGLGQFEPAYQKKLHERFTEYEASGESSRAPLPEFVFRDPHNWIISFWLNTGLLGFVSFTFLTIYLLLRIRWITSTFTQSIALALVALLLFGLVDTIYWKNDLAALCWLLIFSLVLATISQES